MRRKVRGKRRRKGKPEKLMQSRMGVENVSSEREKEAEKRRGIKSVKINKAHGRRNVS